MLGIYHLEWRSHAGLLSSIVKEHAGHMLLKVEKLCWAYVIYNGVSVLDICHLQWRSNAGHL